VAVAEEAAAVVAAVVAAVAALASTLVIIAAVLAAIMVILVAVIITLECRATMEAYQAKSRHVLRVTAEAFPAKESCRCHQVGTQREQIPS